MSLRKQAIEGLFWSAVQSWGSSLLVVITYIILAAFLGPAEMGLVAVAAAVMALLDIFVSQGFSTAIIQRPELSPEYPDTAFWINLAASFFVSGLALALADLIATLLKQPQIAPIIRWLTPGLVVGALSSTQVAILRRNLAFRTLAIRRLIATSVGGVIGVSMAATGYGVWSLVGQSLGSSFCGMVVLWSAARWRPALRFSKSAACGLTGFGIHVVGVQVLDFLHRRADNLIISFYLGAAALGYYGMAYAVLATLTRILTETGAAVSLPVFSRIQNKPEQMSHGFLTVTRLTAFLAFPSFCGLIVVAPDLVSTFLPSRWQPTVPVMQALAVMGITQCVTYPNATVMVACGRPGLRLWLQILNAGTALIAIFVAIPWGTVTAVAVALAIRSIVTWPIRIAVTRTVVPVAWSAYCRQLVAPALGSAIMMLAVACLRWALRSTLEPPLLLVMGVVAGVCVYLMVMSLLARSSLKETADVFRTSLPWRL